MSIENQDVSDPVALLIILATFSGFILIGGIVIEWPNIKEKWQRKERW